MLKTISSSVSTRALPNRSPSLPASGVHTDAESRNPVSTQDVVEDSRAELPREGGDRRRDERLRQGVGQRGQQERPDDRRGRLAVDRADRHAEAAATCVRAGSATVPSAATCSAQARVDRVAQVVALRGREAS